MLKKTSRAETSNATFQTTIGDLIEAIAEIGEQAGRTEQETYRLASIAIEHIQRRYLAQEVLLH